MTTATSTLGPCAEFVDALRQARLIDEDQLGQVQTFLEAKPATRPAALADLFIAKGVLTTYQAETALLGRAHDLVLSNFILTNVLGAGSMGTVYKARSIKDPHWYAIKIVPRRNVANLKAVVDNVRKLKETRHPRVSALVQVGAHGERVYLAWPFLEGGQTLEQLVSTHGRLTPRQTLQVGLQLASGLQAYHDQGLFHGLLKPSDINVGADNRMRILDFGVGFLVACERGKSVLDTMTNSKALARGLDCAAPETHLNPIDRTPAGDRYSLGCILFYCLTGQYPFPEPNLLKKMLAHQSEEPPDVRELALDVPRRLADIIDQLLSKDPADRFETTGDLVQAFRMVSTNSSLARPNVAESKSSSCILLAGPKGTNGQAAAPASPPEEAEEIGRARFNLLLAGGVALGGVLGVLIAFLAGSLH